MFFLTSSDSNQTFTHSFCTTSWRGMNFIITVASSSSKLLSNPSISPCLWAHQAFGPVPQFPLFSSHKLPLAVKLATTARQITPKCTSPTLHSLVSPAAKQKMCIWWWLKVFHYSVSEVKQGMLTAFLFDFNAVSVYSKVSLSSAALFLLEGCLCNAFS